MYLSLLNKNEKIYFLGLAYNIATIDGNYSNEEKAMINGYCQEMQVEFNEKTMINSNDFFITKINSSSDNKVKKIILFELIGLAMSDNNYDEIEKEMVLDLSKSFKIESSYLDKCEDALIKYITFQNKLNKLVLL